MCGLFALAVGAWINVSVCLGQNASTGAIAGTVTDPSDKTIPDAQITVTNEATHATTVVKTRSGGAYRSFTSTRDLHGGSFQARFQGLDYHRDSRERH